MAATATSAGCGWAAARAAHRWQARAPPRMLCQPGSAQPPAGQAPARPRGADGPRVGDQGFHPRRPQLGLGLLMGQERSNPALPTVPAATLPTPDAVQPRGDQRPAGQALARPRHIGTRIRHHRLHPRGAHVRDRDQWVDPPAHNTPCHPKGPQFGRTHPVGPAPTPRHPIMPVLPDQRSELVVLRIALEVAGPWRVARRRDRPAGPGQHGRRRGRGRHARRGPLPHRRVAHRQRNAAPDAPAIPACAGT